MRPHRVRSRALLASALLLVPAACTVSIEIGNEVTPPITLTVMSFNIEYGGQVVDFDQVVEAIRKADPDIVGIQEAFGRVPQLARRLGMNADPRVAVLAKGRILSPAGADGRYAYVEVAPGQVVAFSNLHLPSENYGPGTILHGRSRADAIAAEERTRVPAAREAAGPLVDLVAAGVPTFLTGDFNSPSSRDWTPAMVGERPQIRFPMPWSAIGVFEDAGLRDSYREVNPNPKADPGLTWPAARPRSDESWNPPANAPEDRIDFVWAGGGSVKAVSSEIVGEQGGEGVSIAVDPWPSDHRAVLSTFEVTPVAPGTMIAVDQPPLVDVGQPLAVVYGAPDGGTIAAVAAGDPADDRLVSGSAEATSGALGATTLATDGLAPGAYEAVLLDPDGGELSRVPFWTREPGVPPTVSTSAGLYAEGEPIDVSWQDGPGNKFDWIGVYERGADPLVDSYVLWGYTGGTVAGDLTLDADSEGTWPLPPGKYTLFYLADDDYQILARNNFEIAGNG